jgi:hypothetical protein
METAVRARKQQAASGQSYPDCNDGGFVRQGLHASVEAGVTAAFTTQREK